MQALAGHMPKIVVATAFCAALMASCHRASKGGGADPGKDPEGSGGNGGNGGGDSGSPESCAEGAILSPATIISVSPADDEEMVPNEVTLSVKLDRAISAPSIGALIVVDGAGNTVPPVSATLDDSGTIVRVHSGHLEPLSTYTAKTTCALLDTDGLPVAAKSWTFQTGGGWRNAKALFSGVSGFWSYEAGLDGHEVMAWKNAYSQNSIIMVAMKKPGGEWSNPIAATPPGQVEPSDLSISDHNGYIILSWKDLAAGRQLVSIFDQNSGTFTQPSDLGESSIRTAQVFVRDNGDATVAFEAGIFPKSSIRISDWPKTAWSGGQSPSAPDTYVPNQTSGTVGEAISLADLFGAANGIEIAIKFHQSFPYGSYNQSESVNAAIRDAGGWHSEQIVASPHGQIGPYVVGDAAMDANGAMVGFGVFKFSNTSNEIKRFELANRPVGGTWIYANTSDVDHSGEVTFSMALDKKSGTAVLISNKHLRFFDGEVWGDSRAVTTSEHSGQAFFNGTQIGLLDNFSGVTGVTMISLDPEIPSVRTILSSSANCTWIRELPGKLARAILIDHCVVSDEALKCDVMSSVYAPSPDVDPTPPSLSYASSLFSGHVGETLRATPTKLLRNGAAITGCAVKAATPALPAWATVDPLTCVISGMPIASMNKTNYTVAAMNSAGISEDATLSIEVLAVEPTSLGSAGSSTCVVNANKRYCSGKNDVGQLGNGNTTDATSLTEVADGFSWSRAIQGPYAKASYAIADDGGLYSWGANTKGELGDGSTTSKRAPQKVGRASWLGASAGQNFVCGLQIDHSLWCWGDASKGQLGHLSSTVYPSRVTVAEGPWLTVGVGAQHTCAVAMDGAMTCFGDNSAYALGGGKPAGVWKAVSAAGDHTYAIKADGSLWTWGSHYFGSNGTGPYDTNADPRIQFQTPTRIGTDNDFVTVASTGYNACAIKSNKKVFCWGIGATGALGNGTTTDQFTPVEVMSGVESLAAATNSFCAVNSTDETWCWGYNLTGQLGDGSTVTRTSPVKVR